MTKIFIDNFSKHSTRMVVENTTDKKKGLIHFGYNNESETKYINQNAVSALFLSLLIHDEIYLGYSEFIRVIEAIGIADATELLRSKAVKIILSSTASIISIEEKLKLDRLILVGDPMELFEENINELDKKYRGDRALLIQFASNAKIDFPNSICELSDKDVDTDLDRGVFSDLGIKKSSVGNIDSEECLKILRVSEASLSFITQNKLKLDCSIQDAFAKDYLNSKLGAYKIVVKENGLDMFSSLCGIKQLPNIYDLYKSKVLSIGNILEYREKYSAKLFRAWLASKEYDEKAVLQGLLSKPKHENSIIKITRFIYPELLGLINPLFGLAGSAVDNYLISKIVSGWHPSVYLDTVLKDDIDKKIYTQKITDERKIMVQRFGKILPNQLCPCQSGKKYKKCHG